MRGIYPQQIWQPHDFKDLAHLLRERPTSFILAGGTIAIPSWQEQGAPEDVIYLPAIPELRTYGPHWCGAAVTLAEIAANQEYPPALRQAARSIAGPGVRNLATPGGNISSRADRCLAVALLALNTWVEYFDPHTATLDRTTLEDVLLHPGRIITRVGWTLPMKSRSHFTRFGLRGVSGTNLATIAIHIYEEANSLSCAIAVGGPGVRPHRLPRAEATWKSIPYSLEEAARAASLVAMNEAQTRETVLAPAQYLQQVIRALVERGLRTVAKEIEV